MRAFPPAAATSSYPNSIEDAPSCGTSSRALRVQARPGTFNLTLTGLQLLDNAGFDGTMDVVLDTAAVSTVSANLASRRSNRPIKIDGRTLALQIDSSMLANTTAVGTAGDFTVTVSNLKLDSALCQNLALGGSMSFTKGGQTATVTFDSNCSYSYFGP